MLMKSVIINLKYLIFRSVSASEGGSLEEQQGEGIGVGGGGGGLVVEKSRAVASALSASAALKTAPTKAARVSQCFSTCAPSEVQLLAKHPKI